MPVTLVVGGQYGSESKGKVALALAREMGASIAVRVGGSNSGHTVIGSDGDPMVFRQIPTASLLSGVTCVLPAGSYVDVEVLLREKGMARLSKERLLIDPNAVIITSAERQKERSGTLRAAIGSTQSGTGAAVQRRISRTESTVFAANVPELADFVQPVTPILRSHLRAGDRVIIEGTQGFGLSLLHSRNYPYTTSRDTTAAAFVSEAGLSPLDVDDIVMVIRAFPIRVGGHSGPLPGETSWDVITSEARAPEPLVEYTSVTHSVRRVAQFHPEIVRQAIDVNQPTRIVLNHLDYIDWSCRATDQASKKALRFVRTVEASIEAPIDYLGFGPASMVKRSSNLGRADYATVWRVRGRRSVKVRQNG